MALVDCLGMCTVHILGLNMALVDCLGMYTVHLSG